MNSLIFLAGMGAGATLAVVMMIFALKSWGSSSQKSAKETKEINTRNYEALIDRNEIGRAQVTALERIAKLVCQHRNVTVADVASCDDCGQIVDYDKETRNWK